MRIALSSIISLFLDSLLPPRRSEVLIRSLSFEQLAELAGHDGSLPYHEEIVKALVWEVKYRANSHAQALAGEYMAELLMTVASEELGTPLLVPVPMHKARRRERGHNQTELLCQAALKHMSDAFEYEPLMLLRTRNTPSQQGLARHKRLHNVEYSMEVINKERVGGRVCVVVDDVSTTGATLTEAKRVLREAGARKVVCVSFAQS